MAARSSIRPSAPWAPRVPLPAVLDFASVPDCDHENEQHVVMDFVDDPVVAGSDAPFTVATDEFLGRAGAWLHRQQFDRCLQPALGGSIQLA